ncbi:MAG TPA: sugar transferase [Actinomycetota bacterium]|nr:sugar transferase [Actinomycetota bacterium]
MRAGRSIGGIAVPERLGSAPPSDRPPAARHRRRRWGVAVACADLAALTALVLGVLQLRFRIEDVATEELAAALLLPPSWVGLFAGWGLYRFPRLAPLEEFRRVLAAGAVGTLGLMATSYLLKAEFPRSIALAMLPGGVTVALAVRVVARRLVRRRAARGWGLRSAVVGTGDEALRLSRALGSDGAWIPVGFVDVEGRGSPDGLPVLGTLRDLERIAVQHELDALDVAGAALHPQALAEVLRTGRRLGVDVRVVGRVQDVLASRLAIEPVGDLLTVLVRPPALTAWQAALKRAADVVGAAALGLATAPLWLAVAAAIKLDSPGPVLFRQERVTRGGRTFRMLKFRTMVEDAAEAARRSGLDLERPFFKLEEDPRVTRVGRFLRRWSLDELPQLWNVLRGDMSLVGPRPLPAEQVEAHLEDLAFRHEVRAGLTGWWQVHGRSDLSPEESLRRDLFYVLNWSLGLDLYILAMTVRAVLSGRGAV